MRHLPPISYLTIKHRNQRYCTSGDFLKIKKGPWFFLVSKMEDPRYEFLVLLHELYEWFTTQQAGIKEEDITKFDTKLVREKYKNDPGCDPKACYHEQHMDAVRLEKFVAKLLNVEWDVYDKSFDKLKYPVQKVS